MSGGTYAFTRVLKEKDESIGSIQREHELLRKQNFELQKLLDLKEIQIKILRYELDIEKEWSQDLMKMLGDKLVKNITKDIKSKKNGFHAYDNLDVNDEETLKNIMVSGCA